ncbi:MAG: alpha/beta fold hydrolase [Acidimicrobiia bacterium]|nr:alpha/beta fold hydrolase [Acidimicrobiia bacterium]
MRTRSVRIVVSLAVTLTLVVGVAACGSSGSSSTTTTVPPILPAAESSFGVGFRQVTVKDPAGRRDLSVDVWYPTAKGTTGTVARYALLPTAYIDSTLAVAEAPIADGSFPLIVYSHGSGGQKFIASFMTEALAAKGFVVVAANHTGDTAIDRVANTQAIPDQNDLNRPADVSRLIDDMLARSKATGDVFSGRVDANRIGVVGHSYGGYTAIATTSGHSTPLGSVTPDPRVKAIVAHAPYTLRLTPAELAADKVPTMLIAGTKDITTPTATNAMVAFESITGPPVILAQITGAAHQSFTDVCTYLDQIPKLPDAPAFVVSVVQAQAKEGCGPDFIDYARGLELINILTIAFLKTYVAGEIGYDTYWGVWAAAQPELMVDVRP